MIKFLEMITHTHQCYTCFELPYLNRNAGALPDQLTAPT